MATYLDGILLIKVLNSLVTWSYKMWHTKTNTSTITQSLWLRNLHKGAPINIVTWPFKHAVTSKTLYFHYHNAYGHKTYQGNDIGQGAHTHKFAWALNEVVLWHHTTNKKQDKLKIHISTSTRLKTTKHARVLTYLKWFSMQMLESSLISCLKLILAKNYFRYILLTVSVKKKL